MKFGTDGVRGVAGMELTPEFALRLGYNAAMILLSGRPKRRRKPFIVGKDPRLSSDMLECALAAGIALSGADFVKVGIAPTPFIPWAMARGDFAGGFMITASHNPIEDIGIKVFESGGRKLGAEFERRIEDALDQDLAGSPDASPNFGRCTDAAFLVNAYVKFLKRQLPARDRANFGVRKRALKLVFDGAHGATSEICRDVFSSLPGDHVFMNCEFDGKRINRKCGSTNLAPLKRLVVRSKADMGFAFDGDGDRVLVVDSTAVEIDGDKLIGALAVNSPKYKKSGAVVVTVMSNLGLEEYLASHGIAMHRVSVGDKFVLDGLLDKGLLLGGEQSGHIVMLDKSNTGDGLLTAARIVSMVIRTGKTIADLTRDVRRYPQYLVNMRVASRHGWEKDDRVTNVIASLASKHQGSARILVRLSGTEPVIRVMTESKDKKLAQGILKAVCDAIRDWDGDFKRAGPVV